MPGARFSRRSETVHGSLTRIRSVRTSRCAVDGLVYARIPQGQKPWHSPSRPGERMTSPSAMASGALNRLLCPDPVRYMSVISGPIELMIVYVVADAVDSNV